MKPLLRLACIAGALILLGLPARAEPVIGSSDEALFISSTTLPNASGVPYALCLKTSTWRAFSVPFWRSAQGAFLSPAACNTSALTPLSDEHRAYGIEGVRPWVLERADTLSPMHILSGFWGWLILPFLIVPYWVYRAFARQETAGRAVLLETMDGFTQTLSQTLGLIAGHNGRLTRNQFARIRSLVVENTGEDVSQEEVIELALPADRPLHEIDISGLGKALSQNQRLAIADAVQKLTADMPEANGGSSSAEISAFTARLFDALGIPDAGRPSQEPRRDYFGSTAPAE